MGSGSPGYFLFPGKGNPLATRKGHQHSTWGWIQPHSPLQATISTHPSTHPSRTLLSTLQMTAPEHKVVTQHYGRSDNQLKKRCYAICLLRKLESRISQGSQMCSGPYGVCDLLTWTIESISTFASYFSPVPCWLSQHAKGWLAGVRHWSESRGNVGRCRPVYSRLLGLSHCTYGQPVQQDNQSQFREEIKNILCVLSGSHVWKWRQVTQWCQNEDTWKWQQETKPSGPEEPAWGRVRLSVRLHHRAEEGTRAWEQPWPLSAAHQGPSACWSRNGSLGPNIIYRNPSSGLALLCWHPWHWQPILCPDGSFLPGDRSAWPGTFLPEPLTPIFCVHHSMKK